MKDSTSFVILMTLSIVFLPRAQSLLGHAVAARQKSAHHHHQSLLLLGEWKRPGTYDFLPSRLPMSDETVTRRHTNKVNNDGLFAAKSENTENEESDGSFSPMEDSERTQRDIDAMMRDQDNASMQSTLFGLDSTLYDNRDSNSDEENAYNAVPLFTGSLVLLISLFFTGYGFFVFFTGDDPIFLNQQPTAPPPESWYNQGIP